MISAVSTGLDSFRNPQDIGPMYPFVGQEWLFVVIAVLVWIGWHVLQNRGETSEEREAVEMYERIGLDRAMFHGGSALIATDEEWAEEQRRRTEKPPPPGAA
jgi:hypothetical protein